MTWSLSGKGLEVCSCKTFCPCWLTADVEPDEGWCSAALAFDGVEGQSGGVDLSGARVAMLADWPGNFHKGGGTARLYFDSATNAAQQAEIQAIFEGEKDGPVPALWNAVIDEWLPPITTSIDIDWSERKVSLPNVGTATMVPFTDANGTQASIYNSVSQTAIGAERMDLMAVDGSEWHAQDLRSWKSADAVNYDFAWAG